MSFSQLFRCGAGKTPQQKRPYLVQPQQIDDFFMGKYRIAVADPAQHCNDRYQN
jgi:hypothetical protein